MTEYTVKIPLEDDVAEALQIYADYRTTIHGDGGDIIKDAVKAAMQELVSKAFELAARKKAADYRINAAVKVEVPEDKECENDGD